MEHRMSFDLPMKKPRPVARWKISLAGFRSRPPPVSLAGQQGGRGGSRPQRARTRPAGGPVARRGR